MLSVCLSLPGFSEKEKGQQFPYSEVNKISFALYCLCVLLSDSMCLVIAVFSTVKVYYGIRFFFG